MERLKSGMLAEAAERFGAADAGAGGTARPEGGPSRSRART